MLFTNGGEREDAEIQIIGSCLFYADCAFQVAEVGVSKEMFTSVERRGIFEALTGGCYATMNGEVDLVRLSDKIGIKYSKFLEMMALTSPNLQMALYNSKTLVATVQRDNLLNAITEAFKELNDVRADSTIIASELALKIDHSTRFLTSESKSMQECCMEFLNDLDSKKEPFSIKLGINEVDDFFTQFTGGELFVIGARPSVGKTSLLTQLLVASAKNGTGSILFSGEMTRLELTKKITSQETGINTKCLSSSGLLTAKEISAVIDVQQELSKLPIEILELRGKNITDFCRTAKRLVKVKGAKIIAVDYLQLITGDKYKSNKYQEISEISRELKLLAMETKTVVIALSQLNRVSETRLDKKPQLSDLRDSGQIEQDANIVLLLGNDTSNPYNINFIIAKNRSGSCGEVVVGFNREATKFGEIKNNIDFSNLDSINSFV